MNYKKRIFTVKFAEPEVSLLRLNSIEKIFLVSIPFIFMYPALVFNSFEKWTLINFFIYSSTLLVFLCCLRSISNTNANSWNLFGFCYFFCFWLNTLQLSTLQVEKNIFDLYVMFLGPLIFLWLLMCTERLQILPVKNKLDFFDLNFVYMILAVSYIAIKFYIYKQVGWRVDAILSEHRIVSGDEFVVPLYSGLSSTISWILLILSPHVKKRFSIIAIISICIFSGFLHVKRGDLIRIILFFIVYFLTVKNVGFKYTMGKKYLIAFLITLGICLFVIFGQWRIAQSGSTPQTIIDVTGVRFYNAYIAWLFAYMVVQFDVFSLSSAALKAVSYQLADLLSLFNPVSSLSYVVEDPLIPIRGFNAGTAFWSFVRDYGSLFYIEMIVFWFLISLLIVLSKKTDCKGAYSFICMLCALFVFGNFFCNRSMILAIIFSNIIYLFTKSEMSKASK